MTLFSVPTIDLALSPTQNPADDPLHTVSPVAVVSCRLGTGGLARWLKSHSRTDPRSSSSSDVLKGIGPHGGAHQAGNCSS